MLILQQQSLMYLDVISGLYGKHRLIHYTIHA